MVPQSILLLLLITSSYSLTAAERHTKNSGVSYPIRFAYIDRTPSWYPGSGIAKGFGVPGYAADNDYNYFALAFWTCSSSLDMVGIWANALTYWGTGTEFGNTTS